LCPIYTLYVHVHVYTCVHVHVSTRSFSRGCVMQSWMKARKARAIFEIRAHTWKRAIIKQSHSVVLTVADLRGRGPSAFFFNERNLMTLFKVQLWTQTFWNNLTFNPLSENLGSATDRYKHLIDLDDIITAMQIVRLLKRSVKGIVKRRFVENLPWKNSLWFDAIMYL
jgi:hypothetical protein